MEDDIATAADAAQPTHPTASGPDHPPRPTQLRCLGREDPLGVDQLPVFAWQPGGPQSAYELEVLTTTDDLVWSSGRTSTAEPFGIRYAGEPLRSRTPYHWRVRVLNEAGEDSPWSQTATFETGILDARHWKAHWIGASKAPGDDRAALYFRHEATVGAQVVRARAYVSALGWYRLLVNGTDLTGHALVPRWTPFGRYAEYQVYDVTDAFTQGANAIGVAVADGRYRGTLGFLHKRARYGDHLGVLAQFELELADGTSLTITSDETWTVGQGRISSADPKLGERVDLRIDECDWARPHAGVLNPRPTVRLHTTPPALIAEEVDRVQVVDHLPGQVTRTPSGMQLIDFGQNFAGVASIRLHGQAGQRVKMLYSEVLTPEGELDTSYLPSGGGEGWFQRDEAVLAETPQRYTPWFTIHGFRYVAVEGLQHQLTPEDVQGVVLSTRMPAISSFEVSDQRLNQLWHNTRWSMLSNFQDTATDCPTRERSGWTGDIQVFSPTALQLADAAPFLRRYLRNVATEQASNGTIPPIIPIEDSPPHTTNRVMRYFSTSVGWGDVAVMLPWDLYRYRGDTDVLRAQYDSAKAWVEQMRRRAARKSHLTRKLTKSTAGHEQYILDTGYHWGEWLRPGTDMNATIGKNLLKPSAVIATAYYAHSAHLLAKIAAVIGEEGDARTYDDLAQRVRQAWRAAFVRRGGRLIGDDTQDEYVRALALDLLEGPERAAALERLVELIERADHHLGTGFLSTPLLLPTLVDEGRADLALRLLLQDSTPSWLGQIAKGATTIWETWEGYDKHGKAKDSHNHFAFGTVVQFLQERVGGLRPLAAGYREMEIAPVVGVGLTSASTSVITPYGEAAVAWTVNAEVLHLHVLVPAGTSALVRLPGHTQRIGAGEHELVVPLRQATDTDRSADRP